MQAASFEAAREFVSELLCTAQVAAYTHHMHHLAIMRKVLLRMKSWRNFIFGDGH